MDNYNSETLIIHSGSETNTMKYQDSKTDNDSVSKNNYSDNSQYQQYIGFMRNADKVIVNNELVENKKKLKGEIGRNN
jgi:hypothetical protein